MFALRFVGLCVGCGVLHVSLVFGFVVRCFCCFDFGVRLLCLVVALLFSVLGLRCCVTGGMCVCSVGWVCFVSCVEAGAFVRWVVGVYGLLIVLGWGCLGDRISLLMLLRLLLGL